MKLLILFYLFTHPSFALDKCEQMQALTCAPGTLNDGTASVSTTNSVQEKMLDILRTKKPQIHADFLKSLNNASAYDVNYALSAT